MTTICNILNEIGLTLGDVIQTGVYLLAVGIWAGRMAERMRAFDARLATFQALSDEKDDHIERTAEKDRDSIKATEVVCRADQTRRYELLRATLEKMTEKLSTLNGKMDAVLSVKITTKEEEE